MKATITRRDAIAMAIAGTAMSVSAASPRNRSARCRIDDVGLQLFTVLPMIRTALGDTLMEIRRAGFTSVELAGLAGHDEEEWTRALSAAGVRCRSMHVAFQRVGSDPGLEQDLDRIVAFARRARCTNIVVPAPWIPHRFQAVLDPARRTRDAMATVLTRMSRDDWAETSSRLDRYGAALRGTGLTLSYHNHNVEFSSIGGRTHWDRLVAETDPTLVSFELDVGWAAAAGIDPAVLLRRHEGRIRALHCRDLSKANRTNTGLRYERADIGTGSIDWPRLLSAAAKAGVEALFIEDDYVPGGLEELARARSYLTRVLGIGCRLERSGR